MKYIYLDQSILILIGKTLNKIKGTDIYIDIINKIKEKTDLGEWAFPISSIHFQETISRSHNRSRNELSKIMGSISKGYSIMSYGLYSDIELLNTINKNSMQKTRDYIIKKDFINFTDKSIIADYNNQESILEMINNGELYQIIVDDIKKQNDKTESFYKETYFTQYFKQLQSALSELPKDKEKNLKYKFLTYILFGFYQPKIFGSYFPALLNALKNSAMDFLHSIPSFHTNVILTYELLNNCQTQIKYNDFKDIIFLSSAIPYCDVVVTEKKWSNISNAKKIGLGDKYGTVITNDLNCLLTL